MLREPRKTSVPVAGDERTGIEEPEYEECGADHLSVNGTEGQSVKRDELHSSGHGKETVWTLGDTRTGGQSARFTNKGLVEKPQD
jgi:hypothetical protein